MRARLISRLTLKLTFTTTSQNLSRNPICQHFRTLAAMAQPPTSVYKTQILPVPAADLGHWDEDREPLQSWLLPKDHSPAMETLRLAAKQLKESDVPVAFPTETVYGLGADATRSAAVKGIYQAKGRPADNPLISHVCDLDMLHEVLNIPPPGVGASGTDSVLYGYHSLIQRFWPGPLTIILPNATPPQLATEVTAGLENFGVRMPASALARSLIKAAGVPLAAPSANASTKPSPTTAEHVLHDLDGRIEYILDGGPCEVGVESTVVDGTCSPPVILRPGGISIDEIRECEGWEKVVKAYKDESEIGEDAPKAPGMKYKHYSPKAKVILYESGESAKPEDFSDWTHVSIPEETDRTLAAELAQSPYPRIGIIRTKQWNEWAGLPHMDAKVDSKEVPNAFEVREATMTEADETRAHISEISLGKDSKSIAHGLFSALRYLDQNHTDIILVEGIEDEGEIAAAVMNRLRKAATETRKAEAAEAE